MKYEWIQQSSQDVDNRNNHPCFRFESEIRDEFERWNGSRTDAIGSPKKHYCSTCSQLGRQNALRAIANSHHNPTPFSVLSFSPAVLVLYNTIIHYTLYALLFPFTRLRKGHRFLSSLPNHSSRGDGVGFATWKSKWKLTLSWSIEFCWQVLPTLNLCANQGKYLGRASKNSDKMCCTPRIQCRRSNEPITIIWCAKLKLRKRCSHCTSF